MKRVVFMGTPDFSVPILQSLIQSDYEVVLVVTQPDRPKGRKKVITPPPVKIEAEKHGLPLFQPEKLTNNYEAIIHAKPDIIVTAAYGQLLPKEILDNPPFGCINVHASLLPELRGGAPIHYAILQGKQETGVTIMYMVEKLDAGDILTQKRVPIHIDDDVGKLHDKLSAAGADLLMATLPKLFADEINPIKQDEEQATFAANIKREQEKIDWSKSSNDIYNQIRGLRPWPISFTTYNGKVMNIWWGKLENNVYPDQPSGKIVKKDKDGFVVVCGDHKGIKVTEIQPAGKKRMTVNEFLRGSSDRIKIGSILGD